MIACLSYFLSMKSKVLLIGIDGLVLDIALNSNMASTLGQWKERGFFAPTVVEAPTWSGPGWSTILTGSTHAQHGVTDNRFSGHNLLYRPDFLSRAFYQDQSTTTFAAAAWPPLVDPSGLGPVIHERREQQLAYQHRVIARDGETHGYKSADAEVAHAALYAIEKAGPDVSFVYFCGADEAGHVHGIRGNNYIEAISRIDEFLAKIETKVQARVESLNEEWLIVVTTDHGHIDEGGHGGDTDQERDSFVIATGFGRENPKWPTSIKPEEIAELILAERA